MDVLLLKILLPGFFADVDDFSCRPGLFKQMQVDQAIVKHYVGLAQAGQAAQCNQVGISRAGAYDVYGSELLHHLISPSWGSDWSGKNVTKKTAGYLADQKDPSTVTDFSDEPFPSLVKEGWTRHQ
jgi:hypothetical protein